MSSINDLARIDVEPPRKMRLMFGERRDGQIVRLRSDGLRSRAVREQRMLQKKQKQIEDVVDTVARGESSSTSSSSFSSSSNSPICPLNMQRWGETAANRKYHPPRQFHGETTMVEHKKRWTYQMACDINAAEQSDDGQMYYIAHPFLPMPRDDRNGVCTATRMNYAAQRLDNRKFRGQVPAVNEIADNESVTCEKCGMRYFFESLKMQQRISYQPPANEEDLPTVLFECPVCKVTCRASS